VQERTMSDFDVFNEIVQQPQRQDSLTEQLADLITVATLLGMYDAADYVRQAVLTPRSKPDTDVLKYRRHDNRSNEIIYPRKETQ
jgi:hypothetical protein